MLRVFFYQSIILLLLVTSASTIVAQNQTTGALRTPTDVYQNIGTAPLPLGSEIPLSVDLSFAMPPAGNQGRQSSCVAWACAYANYSYLNKGASDCSYTEANQINQECVFSPAFIYNQINQGQNKGTNFQDAFRIMKTQGCAPYNTMPYSEYDWRSRPSQAAIVAAATHKIDSYWQLGYSGEDIMLETKAYLAKGIPVIASVKVDNYLMRSPGPVPNPYVWEMRQGAVQEMGHAILIVGYNEDTKRFKFLNSYGTNWGNNGYGYISYDVYKWAINEAFIIRTADHDPNVEGIFAQEEKNITQNDVAAGLEFNVGKIDHVFFPNIPTEWEYNNAAMTIYGNVKIPPGLGNNAQVVIYFYANNYGQKGQFIFSSNPMQRTLSGQAVTGTTPINIENGMINTFWAKMRYNDLNLPKGIPFGRPGIKTDLLAEPVLLIDGFPIRIGNIHSFSVIM